MHTLLLEQLVGQTIGKQGQYRVERFLGQYRLNAVYLAHRLSDQEMVALTLFVLPEQFSVDAYQRFMQRFLAAAPMLVALHHPHILPVYEFGEHSGYPYLITPYLTNGSLADRLHQQQRLSYEEVLKILRQIVPALQLAHNQGIVHGTLKPANLVLDSQQQIVVAGFGLKHILQLRGIVQSQQPFAHLLSLAETLLVAPEYLAPEIVEGSPIDRRSDVYALGCILFELLSGTPPFKGNDPLTVAQMHTQQPLPSLSLLVPEIPLALVSVVHQALERDPQRRFQQVTDVLNAFSQVVAGVAGPQSVSRGNQGSSSESGPQDTPAQGISKSWQLAPPIITGKIAALSPRQVVPPTKGSQDPSTGSVVARQIAPPVTTGHLDAIKTTPERPLTQQVAAQPLEQATPPQTPFSEKEADEPHRYTSQETAWWAQSPSDPQTSLRLALPTGTHTKGRKNAETSRNRTKQRVQQNRSSGPNRRQILAVAATGGIVAAGALLVTKLSLFHSGMVMQQTANTPMQMQMAPQGTATKPQQQQNPQKQANLPQATMQPTQAGTVIGSTTLAVNSRQPFSNPADGKSSLLIHLPNGNFVAYKRACTHVGVSVDYDPGTHTLICPAHGAIFDPMKNGAVLQGPATLPLPMVEIQVKSDGTITTM